MINKNVRIRLNTLTIYTDTVFSKHEYEYLQALAYLLNSIKNENKDNIFCMYINKNAFLIADHNTNKSYDPFAFVNEKGEILFEINIKLLEKAIREFEQYKIDCKKRHPELPDEKILQKAIKEYKNDKIDFYSNCKIVQEKIIDNARQLWENIPHF